MGKEIELCSIDSVLHFYQGCEILVKDNEKWFKDIIHIVCYGNGDKKNETEIWGYQCESVPVKDVKLLLKRIEDMTEDEETEYFELCKSILHFKNKDESKGNVLTTADSGESFAWLIENRFDCFKLIDRAIAVDINNIPKNISKNIIETNVNE